MNSIAVKIIDSDNNCEILAGMNDNNDSWDNIHDTLYESKNIKDIRLNIECDKTNVKYKYTVMNPDKKLFCLMNTDNLEEMTDMYLLNDIIDIMNKEYKDDKNIELNGNNSVEIHIGNKIIKIDRYRVISEHHNKKYKFIISIQA